MGISLWIARNTYLETIRQPSFALLTALVGVAILISPAMTLFVMRDATPLIIEMGIGSITLCGLLICILASCKVVSEEIEKRTALTILSKPVSRESFLVGKVLGIWVAVLVSAAALLLVLLFAIWYQGGEELRTWSGFLSSIDRYGHLLLEGGVLSALQLLVMSSFAVAVATRCGLVGNVCTVLSMFALGHLSGYIRGQIPEVGIGRLAQFFLRIIPDLEAFNIGLAITEERSTSVEYVGICAAYAACYACVFYLVGLLFFRRQELM